MAASAFTQQLVQIPICRGLTEAEVREVFASAEERTLNKSAMLFQEGDAGDALFIVLAGSVEVLKRMKDGSHQSLAKVGDGSVLGEMSLLNGNAPRSASAVATSDVRLLVLPSRRFSSLLQSGNIAALKMVSNLAQVISRRLLLMDEKLIELLEQGKKKEELVDFQRILSKWSF